MNQRQDGRIAVLSLDAATDYRVAGRKAATLARLAARGLPVPPGVVLPAAEQAPDHDREPLADRAADLLAAVRGWGDVPLAVRSSGVDEDGADASYAGLFTSVLRVRGENELLAAVRTCWRSARGARVAAYAAERPRPAARPERRDGPAGAPPGRPAGPAAESAAGPVRPVGPVERAARQVGEPVERAARQVGEPVEVAAEPVEPARLAVLIQPMVAASAAGVAFTADPVTGERDCVVIDAVTGTGERLVSGTVTPDRWLVRGATAVRRSDQPPVLDEALALSVAELARRVEAELGGPQDIEWALSDGEVIVLQARPVTALPPEPVPIPITVPPGYWTREGSHAPTPWRPFSRWAAALRNTSLRRVAISSGLLFDGVEFREIGGWDYVRVVPLGGRQLPRPPGWLAPLATLLTPLVLRLAPAVRRRTRAAVATVRSDRAGDTLRRWSDEWRPEFDARIRGLRGRPLDSLPDPDLAAHLDEVLSLTAAGHDVHFELHGALALVLGELAFTGRDLLGWDDARLMSALSGSSTASAGPALALAKVAALAGPRVRALLAEGAPADRVLAADAAFTAAFTGYLTEYGCRALSYELAEPNLDERPELVLGLIRDQIASGFDPGAHARLTRRRDDAVRAAYRVLDEPARSRFERAWQRALTAYPVREDNEFYTISAPFALLRRAALELGRRLAGRGQLAAADDVFFLRPDEARSLLVSGTGGMAVVERRKGELSWALAHSGPASYGVDPGPPPSLRGLPAEARLVNEAFLWTFDRVFGGTSTAAGSGAGSGADFAAGSAAGSAERTLTGIAASGGRYTGPVRVIRGEAEFGRLRAGDVLVCPVTSPVWSVLFPSVGALVTDHGGTLSHSAIIAREYCVPAVVATGVGTQRLRDGQLVTVDGTAGTVELFQQRSGAHPPWPASVGGRPPGEAEEDQVDVVA